MSKKILVINGHCRKKKEKVQIGQDYPIIAPDNAEVNYILFFEDKQQCHLEEMTTQSKIWPITQEGQSVEWKRYQQTSLNDMVISPLQNFFTTQIFAKSVLDKTTGWENLSTSPHDVLARGAMAIRISPTQTGILEDQALITYLQKVRDGQPIEGTPIFYCDKELGKVEPLGNTTLSEIYSAIGLINEFKAGGADIVVATCSFGNSDAKSIKVRTDSAPLPFSSVKSASVKPEKTTSYTFVCSDETFKKFHQYRLDLFAGKMTAGKYLAEKLAGRDLNTLADEQFIELLVQTKPDRIFAESSFYSPSVNWSALELSLLGDISCIIPTKAYDNGAWSAPKVHKNPLDVTLIYVPGPLLRSDHNVNEKPDLDEVCPGDQFDAKAYYHMLERRLLPGLLHVNAAAEKGEDLFLTVPGIGCGQFSGNYSGIIHKEFEKALDRLLTTHSTRLTQVKAIWYDNYSKDSATKSINGIDFLTRPLTKGGLPQLCAPKEYGDKYAHCKLVSFVAWDHVSKPGNDYWGGARATDDGVKGAATDTMPSLTGMEGVYRRDRVVPKEAPDMTWSEYTASKGGISLKVVENFSHYAVFEPFVLQDPDGDSYVTSVELLGNKSYKIHGTNNNGEPRYIIVDKDGQATGFNGSKTLGIVEGQMFANKETFLKHFNVQIANVDSGKKVDEQKKDAQIPKPKVVPVLFTSANHVTAAHVQILSDAAQLLSNRGFEVSKSVISPVNDVYINQFKQYDKVNINGKSFERSLLTGEERVKMAQATIVDAKAQNMEVSDFEIKHTSVPKGDLTRGYIEHWEMLEHLQREEIQRCKVSGEVPRLFVLVGGSDLADGMSNWNKISPGIPFLAATRKTVKNPTGALKSENNFVSPTAYLKKLGYEGDAFSQFKSGAFQIKDSPLSGLSSTQLASCKLEALHLMGNIAFAQLITILLERCQSKILSTAQAATAKASLELIKNHALSDQLEANKKEIVLTKLGIHIKTPAEPVINKITDKKDLKQTKEQQAQEKLKVVLEPHKIKFNVLLEQLKKTRDVLAQKAKNNSNYITVTSSVSALCAKLEQEMGAFFTSPSAEHFQQCQQNCDSAIKATAEKSAEHRGWHAVDSIIKGILGVLAAITVLPALIAAASTKQGYVHTFFAKPETATSEKITAFTAQFEKQENNINEEIRNLKK